MKGRGKRREGKSKKEEGGIEEEEHLFTRFLMKQNFSPWTMNMSHVHHALQPLPLT